MVTPPPPPRRAPGIVGYRIRLRLHAAVAAAYGARKRLTMGAGSSWVAAVAAVAATVTVVATDVAGAMASAARSSRGGVPQRPRCRRVRDRTHLAERADRVLVRH